MDSASQTKMFLKDVCNFQTGHTEQWIQMDLNSSDTIFSFCNFPFAKGTFGKENIPPEKRCCGWVFDSKFL